MSIRSNGAEFSIRVIPTIRSTRAMCIDAHFEQHSCVPNGTKTFGYRADASVCITS